MKGHTRIVAGALLVIAAGLFLFHGLAPNSRAALDIDIRTWISNGASITDYDFVFESIASQIARQTPYAGRINIGATPRRGFLNFYAVRRDALLERRPELACGCASVPRIEAIVCDADFLEDFSDSIAIDDDAVDDEWGSALEALDESYYAFLIRWIVGHEVGHLILGHGTAGSAAGTGSTYGSSHELDADLYMISRLANRRKLQMDAYLALSQFVARSYGKLVHEQYPEWERGKDDAFPDVSVPAGAARHPHLLIRATRLANVLIDYYPAIEDTTGHFTFIESRVKPSTRNGSIRRCPRLPRENPDAKHPPGFLGEAELVNRLILNGDHDEAQSRISHWWRQYPESRESMVVFSYLMAFSIWNALNSNDQSTAKAIFEKSHKQLASFTQYDAGFALMYLRVLARYANRTNTVAEHTAELDHIYALTEQLINEEIASSDQPPNERQLANIYMTLWQYSVDVRGLNSERAMFYLTNLLKLDAGPSVTREFFEQWLKELRDLPDAPVDGTSRTDHLLLLHKYLAAKGLAIESIHIGLRALPLLDAARPSLLQLRANYRISIGREMLEIGRYTEASRLLSQALDLLTRHAESIAIASSEELNAAWKQVASAQNDLGFALTLAEAPDSAIAHLRASLSLLEKHGIRDLEARGATENNLATAYLAVGDGPNALLFARRAVATRTLAKSDPQLLTESQLTLAASLFYSGAVEESKALLKNSYAYFEWSHDSRPLADSSYVIINRQKTPLRQLVKELGFQNDAIDRLNRIADGNQAYVERQIVEQLENEL